MEVYIVINETSCLEMRRKITTVQTWCRRSFAPVFYNPVGGAKCSGNGITWFKEYRGLYLILMNLRKFSWFMPFGEFNLTKGNCKVLCEQSFKQFKETCQLQCRSSLSELSDNHLSVATLHKQVKTSTLLHRAIRIICFVHSKKKKRKNGVNTTNKSTAVLCCFVKRNLICVRY